MAVDPAQTDTARNIGNEPTVRLDEVVTQTKIQAELMVFDATENRLGHGGEVKLIVTPQPTVTLPYTPADACRQELRADFITMRAINETE